MTLDETAATQVLARLAAGAALRRNGDEWTVGASLVSAGQVAALVRAELVVSDGGEAVLTEIGRLRVERAIAPERPNRWLVERGRAGRERVLQDLAESPLGWLMRRGLITHRQFNAGERLRSDFLVASTPPSVTMRWEKSPGGRSSGPPGVLDPTEAQLAAKRRFEAACHAVGGGLNDVLTRVVCLGEGLTAAERALGWPTRAGKVVLSIALDRLAGHYD